MPLLLKIIVIMVGGLYLADQSEVVCGTSLCNVYSESTGAPLSQNSREISNKGVDHFGNPTGENLGFSAEFRAVPRTESKTISRYSAATFPEEEDGIEGTGFSFFDYEDAVAEGGIEGTGIQGDFGENPMPLEYGPDDEYDSDEGGIEGTGIGTNIVAGAENQLIAYGPITQFGSIYVNGVKYEIDDAELEFVNDPSASELSIGMMVQVQADWQQRTNDVFYAKKVTFDRQIEGPIKSVARHGDVTYLEILGTTVVVASDTAIAKGAVYHLNVEAVVTVSGITNEKGQLLATYIALRSEAYHEGQTVELENTVDVIDVLENLIVLNGVSIDVSQARWKQGNLQTLELGTRVEVVGQYEVTNNRIIAQQVRVKKSNLSLKKGNKLSVDTIVTHYHSNEVFRLNGYKVNASEAEFIRGKRENLRNGVRVRATGYINAEGIFDVHTLRIKPRANFAIKAPVNSINRITGEIGVLNLKAYTESDTVYQSKLRAPNKYFSIHDIEIGDWVEIQGVEEENRLSIQNIFALRNKPQMILKGYATNGDKLTLLGIEVQPTGLIPSELVSAIEDGDMIVVKGTIFDGSTLYAREIIVH